MNRIPATSGSGRQTVEGSTSSTQKDPARPGLLPVPTITGRRPWAGEGNDAEPPLINKWTWTPKRLSNVRSTLPQRGTVTGSDLVGATWKPSITSPSQPDS
jgi:hypothetical protein